jgi:hypothetical protein
VRSFVVFPASLEEDTEDEGAGAAEDDGAGSGAVDALGLGAGAGEVVVAEGVGVGVGLPPPSSPPSRLPRSSSRFGSEVVVDGVGLALGVSDVVGAAVVADFGAAEAEGSVVAPEDPEDAVGLALGVGVPLAPSDALGLALGSGVAVPDPSLVLALSVGDGVSDWVTQGPALKDAFDGWSSACAKCGVRPMPMSTAVGMAASATAFPAGTCSLVSSDLRGAAWRGPDVIRDPAPVKAPSLSVGC